MIKKILHILPHLGGGVGKVWGNISLESKKKKLFLNEFFLLDKPQQESIDNIKKYSLDIVSSNELFKRLEEADIVQIEWWNNPLLTKFLSLETLPKIRLIVYSHISGFFYPNYIPEYLFEISDKIIASTEYTFNENPLFKNEKYKTKVSVIHSCSGLSLVENLKKKKHDSFNIGYIGTVDYSKMHPDFIEMSKSAKIKNKKIIICGSGKDLEDIKEKTKDNKEFEVLGYVNDISSILSILDVFGYPLNKKHYGTGEQAIIEALGAGIPIVVMDNGAEKEIVKHNYNGLIASNKEEYSRHLETLANNRDLMKKLGENAKKYAIENFCIDNTVKKFNVIYDDVLLKKKSKKEKMTNGFFENNGFAYFINSLGSKAKHYIDSVLSKDDFALIEADNKISEENLNYISSSKGSIFQYRNFFPNDDILNFWCGLICLKRNETEKSLFYFNEAKKLGFKHKRINKYISYAKNYLK